MVGAGVAMLPRPQGFTVLAGGGAGRRLTISGEPGHGGASGKFPASGRCSRVKTLVPTGDV
jgi:hypothetical protein